MARRAGHHAVDREERRTVVNQLIARSALFLGCSAEQYRRFEELGHIGADYDPSGP